MTTRCDRIKTYITGHGGEIISEGAHYFRGKYAGADVFADFDQFDDRRFNCLSVKCDDNKNAERVRREIGDIV